MNRNKSFTVIDAHAHPPRKGVPGVDARPYTAPRTRGEIFSMLQNDLDECLEDMDQYKIDAKLLLALPPDIEHLFHYGEKNNETGITTLTSHEWIIEAQKRHPKRFYGVVCLDPTLPQSIEALDILVRQQHFKGVKIHQAHYQFEVNDKKVYPFYRKCIELDIPVAFHTGYSGLRDIDRLIPTMPLLLDELAYDLPELKIVMCHVGGNWYQEGVLVALRNENIMVDISGIPSICRHLVYPKTDPSELIKRIVDVLGPDRIMYGTDNMDSEMNLVFINELGLDDSAVEKIMGQNAIDLFRLRDE